MSHLQRLVMLIEETDVVVENSELWHFADRKSFRFLLPKLGDWVLIRINLSKDNQPREYIRRFLKLLVDLREEIQAEEINPGETSFVRSYNSPRDGRAYYFNSSGAQLREVRKFSIENKNTQFDDKPNDASSKIYPTVTKKGTTYLFLWFCPSHGHCWGYHIIPSSEGRKDSANSLYCFLEKAPETVFYDFACSLEEYCRNRESGYYRNTRYSPIVC